MCSHIMGGYKHIFFARGAPPLSLSLLLLIRCGLEEESKRDGIMRGGVHFSFPRQRVTGQLVSLRGIDWLRYCTLFNVVGYINAPVPPARAKFDRHTARASAGAGAGAYIDTSGILKA